jgi:hypothetical protein
MLWFWVTNERRMRRQLEREAACSGNKSVGLKIFYPGGAPVLPDDVKQQVLAPLFSSGAEPLMITTDVDS